MRATRIITATVAATVAITASAISPTHFPGPSVSAHAQGLPSQIEVPAGETTTVDVGVPVNVGYGAAGWSVSASGTVVSVTAPNQPGSTASVPVSAAGRSATVTLVAVGGGADSAYDSGIGEGAGAPVNPDADSSLGPGAPAPVGPDASSSGGSGPRDGSDENEDSSTGSNGVVHPPREPASPVTTTEATIVELAGAINKNVITVKVSLGQAADLMKYSGIDRDGIKLRYIDVNGRIIEGVRREIDPVSREMTLTYPKGETPDNPFILEVVRDEERAEFIAVIRSSGARIEAATDQSQPYARFGAQVENSGENPGPQSGAESGAAEDKPGIFGSNLVTILVIGSVVALVIAAVLAMFLRKRRSK